MKFLIAAILASSVQAAQAVCFVQMLDTYTNQPVKYEPYTALTCQDALRDCNRDRVQMGDRDRYKCDKVDTPITPPGPNNGGSHGPHNGGPHGPNNGNLNNLPVPRIGDQVVLMGHQNNSTIQRRTLNGSYEVRNMGTGSIFNATVMDMGVTEGCVYHPVKDICVGETIIARYEDNFMKPHNNNSKVEAVFRDGTVAYRNMGTQSRFFTVSDQLAVTSGCIKVNRRNNLCIGDKVRGPGHNYLSTVEGIYGNNDVLIRNTNTQNRFIFPVNQLQ